MAFIISSKEIAGNDSRQNEDKFDHLKKQ